MGTFRNKLTSVQSSTVINVLVSSMVNMFILMFAAQHRVSTDISVSETFQFRRFSVLDVNLTAEII